MLLEPSGLDFGSILMDFGRIWAGFWKDFRKVWEEFARILGDSGPLWAILGCWEIGADFRKILVGAPCCNGILFERKL